MDESLRGISIIGRDRGQSSQGLGLKTLFGSLAGFAMATLVGDLFEPVVSLQVDIGQVGESAQRPEVLA